MAYIQVKTAPALRFAQIATLNPTNITANSVSEQSFTVTGLETDMVTHVMAKSLEANVGIIHSYVSAANTLKIRFVNLGGGDVNPASQDFYVLGF